MFKRNNQTLAGFTLVELMIVLSISSLALTLVGGIGVQEYRKYQIKSEQMTLKSFLRQVSHLAFVHERVLTLKVTSPALFLYDEDKKLIASTDFDFISLQKDELKVSKQGFFSKNVVRYQATDKQFELNIEQALH